MNKDKLEIVSNMEGNKALSQMVSIIFLPKIFEHHKRRLIKTTHKLTLKGELF